MARVAFAITVAGIFLLFGQLSAAPPQIDGVYALGGQRLLRIEQNKLEILYDSQTLGRQRVTGTVLTTADELHLVYFNGEKQAKARVTFGLVGDHLWVGVMKRRREDLWTGTTRGAALFGEDRTPLPDGEIAWDLRARQWSYAIRGGAPTIVGPTRAVPAGKGRVDESGERFVAVVEAGRGAEALKWVLDREPAFCDDMRGHPGFLVSFPAIALQQGPGAGPATEVRTEQLLKAVDAFLSSRPATYERIGDVMLTPWSVDLGPVGLVPATADANKAVGHWESSGRGLDVRTAAEQPPMTEKPKAIVRLGRPGQQEIEAMESQLEFDAGDGGVHTKPYGWSCGMGHSDHSGVIYWFLTQDDRLVRIVHPAHCDGGSGPLPQRPRVDVYVRK